MNIRSLCFTLTLLLACCFASAQDATFRNIIGRNPKSTDFRVSSQVARRNHTPLTGKKSLDGNDWQMSLGPTAGLAIGQYPGVYDNFTTPACTDWVMYPINAAPARNQN